MFLKKILQMFTKQPPPLFLCLNQPIITFIQVNEEIYPMGMYSSFLLAVVIFLITDWLRYKPIIILDGITGILTYGLLLGTPTMSIMYVSSSLFVLYFYVACKGVTRVKSPSDVKTTREQKNALSFNIHFTCTVFLNEGRSSKNA